jgi:hypothetical protein
MALDDGPKNGYDEGAYETIHPPRAALTECTFAVPLPCRNNGTTQIWRPTKKPVNS